MAVIPTLLHVLYYITLHLSIKPTDSDIIKDYWSLYIFLEVVFVWVASPLSHRSVFSPTEEPVCCEIYCRGVKPLHNYSYWRGWRTPFDTCLWTTHLRRLMSVTVLTKGVKSWLQTPRPSTVPVSFGPPPALILWIVSHRSVQPVGNKPVKIGAAHVQLRHE